MLGADYIRVLYVDLTKEKVSVEERKDLFHLLGGTGVAAKLLEENMHPELPALHEDQPIVFAIDLCRLFSPSPQRLLPHSFLR